MLLQSSSLEEKLPRMYGPTELSFVSLAKTAPKISTGKIKGIIIIGR